jgi:hypothetical protein
MVNSDNDLDKPKIMPNLHKLIISTRRRIPANGTAVEGVCVTRRNPPVDCPGCEQGISPGGPPGMARYLQSRVRLV